METTYQIKFLGQQFFQEIGIDELEELVNDPDGDFYQIIEISHGIIYIEES